MTWKDDRVSAQLKTALLEYRQTVRGGGYPVELRERAGKHARRLRSRGASIDQIAAELGVTVSTARDWSIAAADAVESAKALSLIPVVVQEQVPEKDVAPTCSGFEVSFPNGIVLRAKGLDASGIAQAIELLARRA